MRRRGFTLLETLLVLCLVSLVLTGLYQAWHSTTLYSRSLTERVRILTEAQTTLRAMVDELRSARRLLYPLPGGGDQEGLAIIDREGHFVIFGTEPLAPPSGTSAGDGATSASEGPGASAGAARSLFRSDRTLDQRRELMSPVRRLRTRVPMLPPGREAGLVHLQLLVDGPGGSPMYLLSSVRLVAKDLRCPVTR